MKDDWCVGSLTYNTFHLPQRLLMCHLHPDPHQVLSVHHQDHSRYWGRWQKRYKFVCLSLTSSTTSRTAASFESSPGSTPPEGTTHRPGCRQLETSSTYNEQQTLISRTVRHSKTCRPCAKENVPKPLSPGLFWNKYSPPVSCTHLHLSFWHCLNGSLSSSWV